MERSGTLAVVDMLDVLMYKSLIVRMPFKEWTMTLLDKLPLVGIALAASTVLSASAWAERLGCNSLCFHGAPGPVVGAGLPAVIGIGAVLLIVSRFRRKAQ